MLITQLLTNRWLYGRNIGNKNLRGVLMDKKRKLLCPECLSDNLSHIQTIWSGKTRKERYQCQDCGRVTVNPIIEGAAPEPVSKQGGTR